MSEVVNKLKDVFKQTEAHHSLKCTKNEQTKRVVCQHVLVFDGDRGKDIPPIVKGKIEFEDTGDSYETTRGGLELFGKSAEEMDAEFNYLKEHIPRHLQKNLGKPVKFGD